MALPDKAGVLATNALSPVNTSLLFVYHQSFNQAIESSLHLFMRPPVASPLAFNKAKRPHLWGRFALGLASKRTLFARGVIMGITYNPILPIAHNGYYPGLLILDPLTGTTHIH